MPKRDTIATVLQRLQASPFPSDELPEEPEYLRGIFRELVECEPPEAALPSTITIEQARAQIADALAEYLASEYPSDALLVKALPGVGKTTAAVRAVEQLALDGKRTLYCGPRHEFYGDVLGVAEHPEFWYEWLPRQNEDGHQGIQTCSHVEAISVWMAKGYAAMDFCSSICGWDYVNSGCPYHRQKKIGAPCLYCQHQHAVLGHPLASTASALVIDEYPVATFCNEWRIPTQFILPSGMDPLKDLTQVLAYMYAMSSEGYKLHGKPLLDVLGGAEYVLHACEWFYDLSGDVLSPKIFTDDDVYGLGYNHLPSLVPLLKREAKACLERDGQYIPRIEIDASGLTLLLRSSVNEEMPRHVVCLDATANRRVYEALLGRDARVVDAQPEMAGRIFQFYERANGKRSMDDEPAKVKQAELLVQHIVSAEGYQQPAIISYKNVVKESAVFQQLDHHHYYAARGTNAMEECDALFVVGAPQPALDAITRLGRMVFFERDKPFDDTWSSPLRPYRYVDEKGKGRAYPQSGYWGDPDLHALLWSMREAEIIQAAHRVRPVFRDVDIWLLENLPIMELPPDELLAFRECIGSPVGTNPFLWETVLQRMAQIDDEQGYVTLRDIVESLGVSRQTATRYWESLLASGSWHLCDPAITRKPGRPPRCVTRA